MTKEVQKALDETRFLERLAMALRAKQGWWTEIHADDGRITVRGYGDDDAPHVPITVIAFHETHVRYRPGHSATAAKNVQIPNTLLLVIEDATFNNCRISCDRSTHPKHHDAGELHTELIRVIKDAAKELHRPVTT